MPHYFKGNQKVKKTEGIIMLVRERMTFQNAADQHNSTNIALPGLKKFSIKAQRDFRNRVWDSFAVYQKNDF